MTKIKTSSLYIHIPFCEHICSYCDFPKLQYFYNIAEKYLISLEKELKQKQINKSLKTIYIGGGTPTSLCDELFEKLLIMVLPYAKNVIEYTVEANPESLSLSKLKLMKKYGVNRISIGVESTNDKILKAINRKHTFNDVKDAIKNARAIGFNNINVDLILGLPNVNEKMLQNDLLNIIELNVEHISCYSLTIHPNTIFGINHVKEIDDDKSRHLYDIANNILEKNNYIHYEISNWCKPHKESIHNYVYWNNETYYGVGLGAAGYIKNFRYSNTKSINDYIDEKYLLEKEVLNNKDLINYQIMLNLRTIKGLSLKYLLDSYACDLYKDKKEDIDIMINNHLLTCHDNILYATYEGMMVLDSILLKLLY